MSTDGTQPPSIAPKKSSTRTTTRPKASSTRVDAGEQVRGDGARTRPVTAPLSGDAPPSVGERIKRSAQNVADAARGAVPGRSAEAGDGAPRATGTATSPAAEPAPAASAGGVRKVRLAVARIDPWSAMKLSFLLSVAIGIMIVVAAAVVWYTLDGLAVFTSVNDTVAEITGDPNFFPVLEYASFDRVISLATLIAVVDVVLLTALSTIGAFLYNVVAALVGGITVTLTDD